MPDAYCPKAKNRQWYYEFALNAKADCQVQRSSDMNTGNMFLLLDFLTCRASLSFSLSDGDA